MSLLAQYLETGWTQHGLARARCLVVAFSGGPDSTALLDLTVRAAGPGASVTAAHLDHAIRAESASEAEHVRCVCDRLGVRIRVRRVGVPTVALARGLSLEAAARSVRYRFLLDAADAAGADTVLTAHHRDDQHETVLMRILRGTGPAGLRSIAPARPIRPGSEVRLVRPLLDFARADLIGYLSERGLPWLTDPTNLDGSNLRSRIRSSLVPWYGENMPDLRERLREIARSSSGIASEWRRLAREAGKLEAPGVLRIERDVPDGILRARMLEMLPPDGPPLDRRTLERIARTRAAGSGAVDLGLGWTARIDAGGSRLRLLAPRCELSDPSSLDLTLPCPGKACLPGAPLVRARPGDDTALNADPLTELIDADAGGGEPMSVRFARQGDRFRPLGFADETTVYRFLMGQGVPAEERGRTVIVVRGETVLWVVGHRVSEDAKVRAATRARVLLEAK